MATVLWCCNTLATFWGFWLLALLPVWQCTAPALQAWPWPAASHLPGLAAEAGLMAAEASKEEEEEEEEGERGQKYFGKVVEVECYLDLNCMWMKSQNFRGVGGYHTNGNETRK